MRLSCLTLVAHHGPAILRSGICQARSRAHFILKNTCCMLLNPFYVVIALVSALVAYQLTNVDPIVAAPSSHGHAYAPPSKDSYLLIAIGDLHGDMLKAEQVLRKLRVINESGAWIAGNTTLIQLGDLVDRGPDSIALTLMFESLRVQAEEKGGSVVTLLGNHEMMLIMGDYRYVNKAEMRSLGGNKGWHDFISGKVGKVLRSKPLAHLTDSIPGCNMLFVHAGMLQWMIDVVVDGTDENPPNGSEIVKRWNLLAHQALSSCRGRSDCPFSRLQESLLGGHGMVWTRAFTPGSDVMDLGSKGSSFRSTMDFICTQAQAVTLRLGVDAIVVGHTVQDSINSLCGGLILMIDVGMSRYVADGPPQGLQCSEANGLEMIK